MKKKYYRYQKYSALAIEALCNDDLYLADPVSFNDPLDCQPIVKSDNDTQTLRIIYSMLVKKRVLKEALGSFKQLRLKGENAQKHATKVSEKSVSRELADIAYHATNPDYEVNIDEAENQILTYKIQLEIKNHYDRGVCCFSSSDRNPLLWSHYGDQHRGFCVGYGVNRNPKPTLHKVEYGGNRLIKTSLVKKAFIDKEFEALAELDQAVLLRKANPWHYEREWRIIGEKGLQKSVLSFEDITFGLRCPAALVYSIVASLDRREDPIKFFEICEDRNSFKLKVRQIDKDEILSWYPETACSGEEMFGDDLPLNT